MIRFKYSLTLHIQEKWVFVFMWGFSLLFLLVAESFNDLQGWIYYLCNITAFIVGWFLGLYLHDLLVEWMRKRTVWKGDWEKLFGND